MKYYTTDWSLNFSVQTDNDAENEVPPEISEVIAALEEYVKLVSTAAQTASSALDLPYLEWNSTDSNEGDLSPQGSGSTDPSKE